MQSKKQNKQKAATVPAAPPAAPASPAVIAPASAPLASPTPAHEPPPRPVPTIAEPVKWFAYHFQKDCRIFFVDAPLAFAGAIVLAVVFTWWAASGWNQQVIRNKDSVISSKDASILGQAGEIQRLQGKISEFQKSEPKEGHKLGDISPEGRARILEKLKVSYQPNYIIHVRPIAADGKSILLMNSLLKLFEDAGFNVVRGAPGGDDVRETFEGLKIISAKPLPSSLERAIDQIFKELGQGIENYVQDSNWNTNIVVLQLGIL